MAEDFRRVADQVAAEIAAGRLRPGDRLPTQRAFARSRRIANSTAIRVYGELVRRGLAVGEVGRGTFVRAAPPSPGHALAEEVAAAGGAAVDFVNLELNYPVAEGQAQLMAQSLAGLLRPDVLEAATRPAAADGTPAAREAAASLLARGGWRPDAGQLLFAGNGRQAIAAAIASFVRPGGRLGVEVLTYPLVKAIAERLGVSLVAIAADGDGLCPDALYAAHRSAPLSAVYVQPTLHNPTSVTMSEDRRARLAVVCGELGIGVVEDTTWAFLAPEPPAPPAPSAVPAPAALVVPAPEPLAVLAPVPSAVPGRAPSVVSAPVPLAGLAPVPSAVSAPVPSAVPGRAPSVVSAPVPLAGLAPVPSVVSAPVPSAVPGRAPSVVSAPAALAVPAPVPLVVPAPVPSDAPEPPAAPAPMPSAAAAPLAAHAPEPPAAPAPLAAYAPTRTVLVDSLSKRLAPGLTIGFLVCPADHTDLLADALRSGAWTAARFNLEAATRWITDGTVATVAAAKRADAVARHRLVQRHLGGFRMRTDPRAYYCWWELPAPWRTDTFVAAAAARGIAITPGHAFAVPPHTAPDAVRIGLASPSREVLSHALCTLAELAGEGTGRRPS